jgi:hypothetical protein
MIKTWENLWFSPIFNGKIWFSVDFPVKPIFGQLPLLPFTNYHQLEKKTAPGKSHLPDLEA